MNITRSLHPFLRGVSGYLKNKPYPSASRLAFFKYVSTETQEQEKVEIVTQEKIELRRPAVSAIRRPPFAKNLFLGIINTDLIDFPEILDNEHVPELEAYIKKINNLFQDKADPAKTDKEGNLPGNLLQDLRELGIFGRLVPEQYGGLGLTMTEYTRLNEVIGLDLSLAASLGAHELLATQALLDAGTEKQKLKYLRDLAAGNKIAALCFHESHSGHDSVRPKTEAKWLPDEKCYSLCGTKAWVTNGQNADLFLVFCKVIHISDLQEGIAVFLVDRDSKGIKVSPLGDKIGLKGSGAAHIQFEDVLLHEENLLGKIDDGFKIVNKALQMCRFGMSSAPLGTLKSVLDYVTEYAINTDRHEKSLGDFDLTEQTLARLAKKIYAMESTSYFTAAIMDSTEDPDCLLESSICKVHNSEGTIFCIREMMKLLGCLSLSNNEFLERLYRDALCLARFDGPNDILKLYMGLVGCQYAGAKRDELVRQSRNPFLYPMIRLRSAIRIHRITNGKVKFTQDVGGHLHPSLVAQSNHLEECVQRLDLAVYALLVNFGQLVTENQLDAVRLANMLIDIYVSTAVLVRSSRSYCIGLRNADQEIKLAQSICDEAYSRIVKEFQDIMAGTLNESDHQDVNIGARVVKSKGYFPEHPLKHNF